METNQTSQAAIMMPERLSEAFRLLRRGRHVCREDGAVFRDLMQHEEQYRIVLSALGFELVSHHQGFYYLKGDNFLKTQRLQAITLFLLMLFQDLEDKKFQDKERQWERTLLTRLFRIDELPHFETLRKRNMMGAVGVSRENLHEKVIRVLAQLGMLKVVETGVFEFRSPVYRFVDLCLKIADENRDEAGVVKGAEEGGDE